jgi:hypothetical protein
MNPMDTNDTTQDPSQITQTQKNVKKDLSTKHKQKKKTTTVPPPQGTQPIIDIIDRRNQSTTVDPQTRKLTQQLRNQPSTSKQIHPMDIQPIARTTQQTADQTQPSSTSSSPPRKKIRVQYVPDNDIQQITDKKKPRGRPPKQPTDKQNKPKPPPRQPRRRLTQPPNHGYNTRSKAN